MGSGAILREVIAAAEILSQEFDVSVDVFSATSFAELARDAAEVERERRLGAGAPERRSHLETLLDGPEPVVAATDYVRAYPQLIAPYVTGRFVTLGTDGFGRSDTRSVLRRFFEVDSANIVLAGLEALTREGRLPETSFKAAVAKYGREDVGPAPWTI